MRKLINLIESVQVEQLDEGFFDGRISDKDKAALVGYAPELLKQIDEIIEFVDLNQFDEAGPRFKGIKWSLQGLLDQPDYEDAEYQKIVNGLSKYLTILGSVPGLNIFKSQTQYDNEFQQKMLTNKKFIEAYLQKFKVKIQAIMDRYKQELQSSDLYKNYKN